MKKNSLAAIFLAILLMMSACGKSNPSETNDFQETHEQPEKSIEETEANPLGFEKENNGDTTFTILVGDANDYDFVAEEITGELVNDEIYNRNLTVEDYLGIQLNILSEPGGWEDLAMFNGAIVNDNASGSNSYDLISSIIVVTAPLATQGVLRNVLNMDYLNLENKWWVDGLADSLAIAGKMYFAAGNANLSLYKLLTVTYFNDKLIGDYQMESPFELVRSGDWTLDAMNKMTEMVKIDTNNDGKITQDDVFGLLTQGVPERFFATAFNFRVFNTNNEGEFGLMPLSERMVDILDGFNAFKNNGSYIVNYNAVDFYSYISPLAENRCLFVLDYLYANEGGVLRDMDDDYGMVPYPKFDKEQDRYYTPMGTATSVLFVPLNLKNVDLTAKTMEVFSYLSTDTVVPAYYETSLKEKYSRSETCIEMLDIIRQSATITFDAAYGTQFEPWLSNIIATQNLASSYQKYQGAWEVTFQKIAEAYASNPD